MITSVVLRQKVTTTSKRKHEAYNKKTASFLKGTTMATNIAVPPAPTAKQRVPIPVTESIQHICAHQDEHIARYLWESYGEFAFPGARTSKGRFTLGLPTRKDADMDAEGKVAFGVGGGRYDEHRAEGPLPDKCSALLVAEDLELMGDKIIARMVNEVLRCDTTRGVKTTELAELIKMFHRRLKNADEFVWKWSKKAIQAVHHQLAYQYTANAGEKTLAEILEALLTANRYESQTEYGQKAVARLREYVEKSTARRTRLEREPNPREGDYIFELAFIVEALHRCTKVITPEDVVEWVRFAFDHLYADQIEFLKCEEFCRKLQADKKGWYDIHAVVKKRPQTLKLFVCKSDSSIMPRAARFVGASVVIIRNSNGNVTVSINANVRGLHMVDFTRMVRWLELRDKQGASWHELGRDGEHPLVDNWYFQRKAQCLMNGSLTHPNKRPTQISTDTLIDVARHAFSRRGTDTWREDHGLETRGTYRLRVRRQRQLNRRRYAAQKVVSAQPNAPKATVQTQDAAAGKSAKPLQTVVTLDELEKKLALAN